MFFDEDDDVPEGDRLGVAALLAFILLACVLFLAFAAGHWARHSNG